jgi:hypothetical protein
MTTHVIIPCSKSKAYLPSSDMVWDEQTTLEKWNLRWWDPGLQRFHPSRLYAGRATRKQLQIVSCHPDAQAYILSAGGGLIKVSGDVRVPSYESTFGRGGPKVSDLHKLPHGGVSNIHLDDGDQVIAFAPPGYLRALSLDPGLPRLLGHLVAPFKSPLGDSSQIPVKTHPRLKEVFGVASADLNTELIRSFLNGGVLAIEAANSEADRLPPPPQRRKVSDGELLEIVEEYGRDRTLMQLVRFIRDNLGKSASVDRIREAKRRDRE